MTRRAAAAYRSARCGGNGFCDRLGSLRRLSAAPSSACTASAPRRRSRICCRNSASWRIKWWRPPNRRLQSIRHQGLPDNESVKVACGSRPGRLARFPVPRFHRQRRLEAARRRRRLARGDVEPVDLRAGHRSFRRIRRGHRPHAAGAGPPGRRDFRASRGRGYPAGRRRAAPDLTTPPMAPTALSASKSRPISAKDTQGTIDEAQAAVAARSVART